MQYNEINEYLKFAYKVFEYLNGEINKVNKNVILSIYPYNVGRLGEMTQRSTLKLYIYDIIERCNNDSNVIKNNILFTIVHELYHTDQFLSPYEYTINQEYNDRIEKQVNYMTIIYLVDNRKRLEENLDVRIMVDHLNQYLKMITNDLVDPIRYKRISIFNYYYEIIRYLFSNLPNNFSDLLDAEPNIHLVCNDEKFIIKKDGVFNENIDELNRIIHENYIKIQRRNHEISLLRKPNFITFKCNTKEFRGNAIEFIE